MSSSNELAVLRLSIADEVPVFPLSVFVSRFRDVYASQVFLDKVEFEGTVPPPDFLPSPEEDLYLNRMEVGTPNFMELLGLSGPLIDTFNWVVMLASGIKGVDFVFDKTLKHVKTFYDIKKVRKELKKPDDIIEGAKAEGHYTVRQMDAPDPKQRMDNRALRMKGVLPDEEIDNKSEYMKRADEWMAKYALKKRIVYEGQITVIECVKSE